LPFPTFPPSAQNKSAHYPETDIHASVYIYLRTALEDHFRDSPDVYISGSRLLYYEQDNPSASVAPDLFVIRGVVQDKRCAYEGKAPDVIIEITARSTWLEDVGRKRAIYAELGVAEYFIYDPLCEYLKPPLQGYHLANCDYAPIVADAQGRFHSEVLDLDLQIVNGELRLLDPHTGKFLLTPLEAQEAARQAQSAMLQTEDLYRQVQELAHQVREELRAEAVARQAADQRAAQAEAEVERLRAELKSRGK